MWVWSHFSQRATWPAPDLIRGCRRAAALDRRHHLQLAEAQMAGLGATPGRPVGAEDVRDLRRNAQRFCRQSRADHPPRRVRRAAS
jgi:hypothetical protein